MNNKKQIIVLSITIIALLLIVGLGMGYAFFTSNIDNNANLNTLVTTDNKTYQFISDSNENIEFNVAANDMMQAKASNKAVKSDNANINVSLASPREGIITRCTYDIVWVWDSNDKYTEADTTLPYTDSSTSDVYNYEFSTKVSGENENDLSTLETKEENKVIIMPNASIVSDNTTPTKVTHNITALIYNLPVPQPNLFNKSFSAHITVENVECKMTNEEGTYAGEYIQKLHSTQGEVGAEGELIYHDDTAAVSLQNDNLGAGDKSYRYSGANPNNYVCFGSDESTCPDNNLYRIIGSFDDDKNGKYQLKLIKADYANETDLGKETGEEGTYYNIPYGDDTQNNDEEKDAFHHRYKGKLASVPKYSYQKVGDENTQADWPTALLNTIHLNKNFYNTFGNKWQGLIDNHNWYYKGGSWAEVVGGNAQSTTNAKSVYQKEISEQKDTTQARIGLMYVSDYLYGASSNNWNKVPYNRANQYIPGVPDENEYPQGIYPDNPDKSDYRSAINENWLYLGLWEWLITQRTDDPGVYAFAVSAPGYGDCSSAGTGTRAVRPTFYLNEDVMIVGGQGTSTDPYRLY